MTPAEIQRFERSTQFEFDLRYSVILKGFRGKNVSSILKIPSGVTEIGYQAFEGHRELKEISIPTGVQRIGDNAFSGCDSVKKLKLPARMTGTGYPFGIGKGAFKFCYGLEKVVLPQGLSAVSDSCFKMCLGLKEAVIPDSVKKIGDHAFSQCKKLKKIVMPLAALFSIKDDMIFGVCDSLKELTAGGRRYVLDGKLGFDEVSRIAVELCGEGISEAADYVSENAERMLERFTIISQADSAGKLLRLADFNAEQIDSAIKTAIDNGQREIYVMLVQYKRDKLGFDIPEDRFKL